MSLFVVGMHRSGTSLLTALLALAGAYIGPRKQLTGANRHNPKGFWEQNEFRVVNERLLLQQHRDWDYPAGFDLEALRDDDGSIRGEARRVLAMFASDCFVVKDPRLCLTFEFWRSLVPTSVPVIPVRNPLEVAFSLFRRNAIPVPIGIALWEFYVLSAAHQSRDSDPIMVTHKDLLHEPVTALCNVVDRINQRIGYVLAVPEDHQVRDFVDLTLHREIAGADDLRDYLVKPQLECWEAARELDLNALQRASLSRASRTALEGYEALGMQFSRVKKLERELGSLGDGGGRKSA